MPSPAQPCPAQPSSGAQSVRGARGWHRAWKSDPWGRTGEAWPGLARPPNITTTSGRAEWGSPQPLHIRHYFPPPAPRALAWGRAHLNWGDGKDDCSLGNFTFSAAGTGVLGCWGCELENTRSASRPPKCKRTECFLAPENQAGPGYLLGELANFLLFRRRKRGLTCAVLSREPRFLNQKSHPSPLPSIPAPFCETPGFRPQRLCDLCWEECFLKGALWPGCRGKIWGWRVGETHLVGGLGAAALEREDSGRGKRGSSSTESKRGRPLFCIFRGASPS